MENWLLFLIFFVAPALVVAVTRSFVVTAWIVAIVWSILLFGALAEDPNVSLAWRLRDAAYSGIAHAVVCWLTYYLATRVPRWLKRNNA